MPRYPLTVRRAIIRSGSFCGVEGLDLASALDMADAEATAQALSSQEPRSIFGVASEETRGTRMVCWLRNGKRT